VYPKAKLYMAIIGLISVLPATWMPTTLTRPSQISYWILYLLTYIPICWVPYYASGVGLLRLFILHVLLLGAFAVVGAMYHLPRLTIPRPQLTWAQYGVFVGAVFGVLFVYVMSIFGFKIRLLSFYEIYSVRDEFKQALESAALAGYAVPWLGNVMHPLLVSLGITKNRLSLLGLGVFGQLYIYSLTGMKTMLLSVVMFVAIYVAVRKEGRQFGALMAWGGVSILVAAIIADVTTGITFIPYIAVGRLIITPGMLTGYYYEFFYHNEKVTMSDGLLSSIANYPYELPPDQIIGAIYRGNPAVNANANIWADAFANFGLVGVCVIAVLLGALFWVFDSLARGRNWKVAVLILGIPSIFLSNTALETSILTHGIGLVLLLLYLMPAESGGAAKQAVATGAKEEGGTPEENAPPPQQEPSQQEASQQGPSQHEESGGG
jgi:hypothetical protein